MRRTILALGLIACIAASCSGGSGDAAGSSTSTLTPATGAPASVAPDPGTPLAGAPSDDALQLAGGQLGTVNNDSADAFAQGMTSLTREERRAFAVGNSFFSENWVTAPSSTLGRDGLGPMMNAQSCSTCHFKDGRGQPPATDGDAQRGLLLRLSVPGPDGTPIDDPAYGGQLQDQAINGVPAEGSILITRTDIDGAFDDGTPYTLERPTYSVVDTAFGALPADIMISPRVAPPVFGVGLLEAVPAATIEATADPDDADRDGISGRANHVLDEFGLPALGRFGWKANVAAVNQQNANAFHGDIGITSSLHPDQECTSVETECADAPNGGEPEIDDQKLARVTFYTRTLAVPARRDVADPANRDGERLFTSVGCASCHTPEMQTGGSDLAVLADQTIRPYTDLLVHDMGEGLADDRPDGEATGVEWRTAPLWGIGLTQSVNGHTRFLHDGRARDLSEAILWHGGEAESAQAAYRALAADERAALLSFLESL